MQIGTRVEKKLMKGRQSSSGKGGGAVNVGEIGILYFSVSDLHDNRRRKGKPQRHRERKGDLLEEKASVVGEPKRPAMVRRALGKEEKRGARKSNCK